MRHRTYPASNCSRSGGLPQHRSQARACFVMRVTASGCVYNPCAVRLLVSQPLGS